MSVSVPLTTLGLEHKACVCAPMAFLRLDGAVSQYVGDSIVRLELLNAFTHQVSVGFRDMGSTCFSPARQTHYSFSNTCARPPILKYIKQCM